MSLSRCLILLLFFSLCLTQPTFAGKEFTSPENVFNRAWEIIADEYLDPTFNGQNWNDWKVKYKGNIRNHAEARNAIAEMIGSLKDSNTRLISLSTFQREKELRNSEPVVGVGISLALMKEKLLVKRIFPKSPAERSNKISIDDEVVAIGKFPCAGLAPAPAAESIRGPEGTYVSITFKKLDGTTYTLVLRREPLIYPEIEIEVLSSNTAHLSILSSCANPAMSIQSNIGKLSNCDKYILDLRRSSHMDDEGLVQTASLFLPEGKVIARKRTNKGVFDLKTIGLQKFTGKLVVLINRDTGGGAQRLAYGLQKLGRAKLVGCKTFGDDRSIKVVLLDENLGIHVSINEWLRLDGKPLGSVKPDVELPEFESGEQFIQKSTETLNSESP